VTAALSESVVEDAALAWLESLGYAIKHGPEIAPGELASAKLKNRTNRTDSRTNSKKKDVERCRTNQTSQAPA